jgi:hypothetical protein
VILSVTVAVPLFALAACDETIDATKTASTPDSGTADSGSAGDSGTATTSLFQRLGGRAGITAFIDKVLVEELKDPEIAPFFASNLQTPPPAGHPTAAQIKGCLVEQIAAASADPTKGDPAIVYPAKLSDGNQCRDMKTTHTGLGISGAVFDKFGAIATLVAKGAGLAEADLKSVGDFLGIQKSLIVEAAPPADGGSDAPVDAPDAD